MTEYIKRDVLDALKSGDLNKAVDCLKTGLKREPYWVWGHRKLGDIYLEGLDHTSYALVQYRKLAEVKETLAPAEKLRLAWANQERGFDDKVYNILSGLNRDDLPESIDLLGNEYDAFELYEQFSEASSASVSENNREYFDKYRTKGDDYRNHGNFFDAQRAYEQALEFMEDENVKLKLAQCLIQRSKYPGALEYLKEVRGHEAVSEEAERLISKVYDRLGLNELFEIENDDDDQPGQSRKVS